MLDFFCCIKCVGSLLLKCQTEHAKSTMPRLTVWEETTLATEEKTVAYHWFLRKRNDQKHSKTIQQHNILLVYVLDSTSISLLLTFSYKTWQSDKMPTRLPWRIGI